MRAGVPLVATAVGGLPELVGDGALLVPPGDVDAVDTAVRSLLDDPGLRGRPGAAGASPGPPAGPPRPTPSPRCAPSTPSWTPTRPVPTGHRDDAGALRPGLRHRRPLDGTRLMLRRFTPVLLTLVVVVLGVTALAARPDTSPPRRSADYVVPGRGGRAALGRRRPAEHPDAVADGPAGFHRVVVDPLRAPPDAPGGRLAHPSARAATRLERRPPAGRVPPAASMVEQPDGIGANLPDQEGVVAYNADRQPWGTVPGSPESVRCSVAVGPGAAVAAACPFGRVDRYAPALPADPAGLLGSCVLSIVDLGTVSGYAIRRTGGPAARRADEALAKVLAARPERSLVLVAGVFDTEAPARLHVGGRRRTRVGERLAHLAQHRPGRATCNWWTWRRRR